MQIVSDILVALLVFLGGALVTLWAAFAQDGSTFTQAVLGPLGALALAMLVIYGLTRYLSAERKEAKEANEKRILLLQGLVDSQRAQIERQQQEIARLYQERHKSQ